MEVFLVEGGLVCAVMTLAGVAAAHWRLALLPLLVAAGIALGPHLPPLGLIDWHFTYSAPFLDVLGRLGLVSLVFSLGLECVVGRLPPVRQRLMAGSILYLALQGSVALVYVSVGNWPWHAGLLVMGMLTLSSQAMLAYLVTHLLSISAPALAMLQGIRTCEARLGALYLTGVTIMLGSGAPAWQGLMTTAGVTLGGVLGGLLLRRYGLPWLNRTLHRPTDTTLVLVLCAGWCVAAGAAETLPAAVMGALGLGLVLAETDHRQRLARLARPWCAFLGAFYCFSFGLTIDPTVLPGTAGLALGAVGCTLGGTVLASHLAGRVARLASPAAWHIGLALGVRGEWALIFASLGTLAGHGPVLQPLAAVYVCMLALLVPLLATMVHRSGIMCQGTAHT
jgi:CPA2 family monovalent cation:H+ antiporter-2